MTVKCGQVIIVAVTGICGYMFAICCNIIDSGLGIVSVKRRNGYKRRDFYSGFQVEGMCIETPVVMVIAVKSTEYQMILQEIIGTEPNRYFESFPGKVFNVYGIICKINPVKGKSEMPVLVNQIQQECDL